MSAGLEALVGRVILAFGRVDQEVWLSISHIQNSAKSRQFLVPLAPIHLVQPDNRFAFRLKLLRRLIAASPNSTMRLRKWDQFKTKIERLERGRAHLAHGVISEWYGAYRVTDARELVAWQAGIDGAAAEYSKILRLGGSKQDADMQMCALRAKHLRIDYSPEILDQMAADIRAALRELQDIASDAMLAWQAIRP